MLAVDKLFYVGIQDFLPPFFSLYPHILVRFFAVSCISQPVFVITSDDSCK